MPKDRFHAKNTKDRVYDYYRSDPAILKGIDHVVDKRAAKVARAHDRAPSAPKQSVEDFLATGGTITKVAVGECGEVHSRRRVALNT